MRNTGDRPIQIGSHFHFFEVNRALDFDRPATLAMRLDIPSGQSIRFEAGDERDVDLVEFGGTGQVIGFNGLLDGSTSAPVDSATRHWERATRASGSSGDWLDNEAPLTTESPGCVMSIVSRQQYASLYGPTVGDRFRLADTTLIAEVERSLLLPGEEAIYGGGKSLRDGMGQVPGLRNADGVLDLVITAVIVMDPVLGIVKADIGVKDGRIVGVGQAGNPYVQDGVDTNMIVGAGTEVISGEGLGGDARGDRHARPLPDPGTGPPRAVQRRHHVDRRRYRPRRRLQGHHVHTRAVEPRPNARSHRGPPRERRAARQGQQQPPRQPGRTAPGRRVRIEGA